MCVCVRAFARVYIIYRVEIQTIPRKMVGLNEVNLTVS